MKLQFLLLDLSDTFRRRRLYFLLPFAAVFVLGVLAAYVLPEAYESVGTVMVQRNLQGTRQENGEREDHLLLFTEIVHSKSTLAAVAAALSRAADSTSGRVPVSDEAVTALAGAIRTERRGQDACRIIAEHADPETAHRIATIVMDVSLQASRLVDLRQLDDAVGFYERKLAEYGQGDEASPAVSGASVPVADESSFRISLARTEAELSQTEGLLALKERGLGLLAPASGTIDEPATISRLSSLESRVVGPPAADIRREAARYAGLLTRYRPRHPEVQSARRQLLALVQRAVSTLQSERDRLQGQAGQLRQRQRFLRERLGSLVARTDTTRDVPRRAAVSQEVVAGLRRDLEQARLERDLRAQAGSRLTILDRPERPSSPVRPDRPLIIGLAALIGLLLGSAGLAAAESLDPTIRRPRDLEVFGKPVIATLP